jgi:hypothetical protein
MFRSDALVCTSKIERRGRKLDENAEMIGGSAQNSQLLSSQGRGPLAVVFVVSRSRVERTVKVPD